MTSAMRRQREEFVSVRLRSKTSANKHILPKLMALVFAIVRLGWYQVGVNRNVLEAPEAVDLLFVVASELEGAICRLKASSVPNVGSIITTCKNFGGILHVEVLKEFSPC